MKRVDLIRLLLVCVIWGANVPITRMALIEAPPLFLAFMRFLATSLILSPFLFPAPKNLGSIFVISLLMGSVNFIFQYIGLALAPAGVAALIGQMGLPIVLIMSVFFLNETMNAKSIFATSLAFLGIVIALFKWSVIGNSFGIVLLFISTFLTACATIFMKRTSPISAMQMQAWVSAFSFVPLLIASLMTEKIEPIHFVSMPPSFWFALGFGIFGASLFAHTNYYSLVKQYDVSIVMPYTVLVPILAIIIARLILKEQITFQFFVGSAICLSGIFLLTQSNIKAGSNA